MKTVIKWAVESRIVIYFLCLVLLVGGVMSFFTLGQLEDPIFTVKTALITTAYPGASPKEVELEVTDRIEKALQEMPQLKHLYSISRAGESIIKVDIKEQYWADRLPQVWDELRKKVGDIRPLLPPGVEKPLVSDDFGFVYGFVLALTGDGYSYKYLEDTADLIKKELSLVKGVARVELWGVQDKVVYLDVSEKQLAELKLTPETIGNTLHRQNMVVDAGNVDDVTSRFRIAPTGEFTSPEEIGELILRPAPSDILINTINAAKQGAGEKQDLSRELTKESENVIRVKDVATVRSDYVEPPATVMRFSGNRSIGISIAGMDDANIVEVGEQLTRKLDMIVSHLPVGLDVHKVAWQSDLVDDAVGGFIISLLEAVAIVLVVLMIPSGVRMGLLIGSDLVLTILGTFIVMAILDIPLQRMSLGALIIALGMMVDNAIVVADGIAVRMRQGLEHKKAAIETAAANAYPLLSATLIATLTFYPIYASKEGAGEYCRTLFIVVATALILSWVIAMLITPLQAIDMLSKKDTEPRPGGDEFDRPLYRKLRWALKGMLRFRFVALIVMLGLLGSALFGFGFVKQLFFPDSSRPQLMIDYWAPAGTRIQQVSAKARLIEKRVMKDPTVVDISTFVGAGPPRFYLPVDPELPYPNYAQLIINFNHYKEVDPFIANFEPWATKNITNGMIRIRKYGVGPSDTWKFEARLSGPGEADIPTLKRLADEIKRIASESPLGHEWRTDTQNPVLKVIPEYDQKRGRWSDVSRLDVANATRRAYDGRPIGLYREGDDLYPILLRNIDAERKYLTDHMDTLQVKPELSTTTVPLSQVMKGVETEWEDPFITRWDRRRSVTIQGSPKLSVTFPELKKSIEKGVDKVKLPPGYEIFWDGEEDSTRSAQQSLVPGIVPAAVAILFLLVTVFNAVRPILIIFLTIPFALIGVTVGLLVFDIPFGFMALLGAMSLAGMMNKNIVILLDAAALNRSQGMSHFESIVQASVSRARPVLLAAGTTILGVIPLLTDVFWVAMAVTIMAGLAFGSLLTLIAVPVFYAFLYRVKGEKK